MNVIFERLFYGRSAMGYGILGASSGAAGFAPRVEALCGAVGTPGGDYDGQPFLLSVPAGDGVIMACGRSGAPDSMGRTTLFFDVLIAAKADLSAAKADAFSLFAQGAFLDKMPGCEVVSSRIDVVSSPARRSSGVAAIDPSPPCVFRSDAPAPKLVAAAVGGRTLDLKWATYAFQTLPGFDVQVIPPRVRGPLTANEYDASGRLVRRVVAANAASDEDGAAGVMAPTSPSRRPADAGAPPPGRSNAMLKFSIVANIVLVAACAALLATLRTGPRTASPPPGRVFVTNVVEKVVEKRVEAALSDGHRTAVEREVVRRFKTSFPAEKRIANFEAEVKDLPKFNDIMFGSDPRFLRCRPLLDKLGFYVDFVNKNILEERTQ